jgi:hypothetical protein
MVCKNLASLNEEKLVINCKILKYTLNNYIFSIKIKNGQLFDPVVEDGG